MELGAYESTRGAKVVDNIALPILEQHRTFCPERGHPGTRPHSLRGSPLKAPHFPRSSAPIRAGIWYIFVGYRYVSIRLSLFTGLLPETPRQKRHAVHGHAWRPGPSPVGRKAYPGRLCKSSILGLSSVDRCYTAHVTCSCSIRKAF